jgi:hypothetical protein
VRPNMESSFWLDLPAKALLNGARFGWIRGQWREKRG